MKYERFILAAVCFALTSCQNRADDAANNSAQTSQMVDPDSASNKERVSERARYRCEGGELVEVDWMSVDGHPRLRTESHSSAIDMTLVGNDYVGEGYSLNGVETISVIGVSWPGGEMKTCQKL